MKKVKLKEGDVLELVAMKWEDPNFQYGSPSVILKPFGYFSDEGELPSDLIDYCLTNILIEEEPSYEKIDLNNKDDWNYKRFRTVARERLRGLDTWESREPEVVSMTVKIVREGDEAGDYLGYEIIEIEEV